jgi:predicted permease
MRLWHILDNRLLSLFLPDRRDARGTGLVDDTVRDILYALRMFKRAPLVAFTIVATVAVGLGLVAGAFTLLNTFLFRVDQVPDVHEMFALERPQTSTGERVPFTRAELDALRREANVFTDAYAEVSGIDFPVDGRTVLFTLVTGNFFQVVGVKPAMGRTLMPLDDEPSGGRPVMVLSDRGWDRLFGRDPAILGRAVLVKGVSFDVVGVMPRGFRGLSVVPPDYWVPLSMLGHILPGDRGREATTGLRIVGRLKPGLSSQAAQAGLAVWAASQPDAIPIARGEPTITLVPWRGTVPQPLEAVLVTGPLFCAFGLILLIGCANVANLLLARSVARQREIGIRLSLGASRRRIVRQLLTESLLLALVAAAAGYVVSRVALQTLVNAMLTSWPPEIGDIQLLVPESDWRVLLFLLFGAGVSALFFGLVPALQATRIEPVRTMRGEVVRDARPGRARNVLIGVQVSVSALLLISAAVFLRSAFAAATADPGLRTSDILAVQIASEATRAAMVLAIAAEPSVAAVAASWPGTLAAPRAAFAEAGGVKAEIAYKFVSPEFFSVLDIAVVRGRAFAPDERLPSLPVAIVSETTARALWPSGDAVGQIVRLDPDPKSAAPADDEPRLESRTVTVVGVVRDVAGFRIAPAPKATIYLPASVSMPRTTLVARVRGDPERARQAVVKRLATIDPTMEQGGMEQVGIIGWVTRIETYLLRVGFWFTVVLGGLALALTVSGLFGVLSYLVEQRTREIGVRMALGADVRDVVGLVLWQSIRPVGVGLFIGAGSAAGLAALLLASPAAATIGQIVHALDPVAYAVSLLIILAACLAAASIPATRAARLDPTRTLRQE